MADTQVAMGKPESGPVADLVDKGIDTAGMAAAESSVQSSRPIHRKRRDAEKAEVGRSII